MAKQKKEKCFNYNFLAHGTCQTIENQFKMESRSFHQTTAANKIFWKKHGENKTNSIK